MNVRLLALTTLLVAGCGGVVPTGEDGQGFAGGGVITHPIGGMSLDFDIFNPTVPLEGRHTIVWFTLTNLDWTPHTGHVGAVVSPANAAPFLAPQTWRIDSIPGHGGTLTGVIAFDAPNASRQNLLTLFFEDASTGQRLVKTDHFFDVAARFDFGLQRVSVNNPRSHGSDTDYAALAVQVNGGSFPVDASVFLGDAPGGRSFDQPLKGKLPVDLVPDLDSVAVGSLVVNWGNGAPKPGELEAMVADVATGKHISITAHGTSCDGIVAANRFVWTGRQLVDAPPTALGDPAVVGGTDEGYTFPGEPSPWVCGATSSYQVTVDALHVNQLDDPEVWIDPPIATARAGQRVHFQVHTPVDWSVDVGAAYGWIDQNGNFTLASSVPPNTVVTVRAVPRDPGRFAGVAYVSVDPTPPPIHLVPVGGFSFTAFH